MNEFHLVPPSFTELYPVFLGFAEFYLVLPSLSGFLPSFPGFNLVLYRLSSGFFINRIVADLPRPRNFGGGGQRSTAVDPIGCHGDRPRYRVTDLFLFSSSSSSSFLFAALSLSLSFSFSHLFVVDFRDFLSEP